MQKITTCLWFDHQAEEAVNFYTSIFKNSEIKHIAYYGEAGAEVSGRPQGSVMTIEFVLAEQNFLALNGGPIFQFTHAISLSVDCASQSEIDFFSEKLSMGGKLEPCGWVLDKYGLSWQIVPTILSKMLKDRDEEKTDRVMRAMLKMEKLNIDELKKAYEA